MRKIFFDYSTMMDWHGHPTGIPRTVECLARSFRHLGETVNFVSFDDETKRFYTVNFANKTKSNAEIEFCQGDCLFTAGATWAYAAYLQEVDRLKAMHISFFALVYDLIPGIFPYFYANTDFGPYYQRWIYEIVKRTAMTFAISEATSKDTKNLFGENKRACPPIEIVRLGDEIERKNSNGNQVGSKFQEFGRYILSVGTLEYRKNHIALLNAYRLLVSEGKTDLPILVIVGREGWLNNSIKFQVAHDFALKGRIKILDDVSDDELDYLYKNCMFTVFPAIYEGWGLPVAESLRYGKQCITSNTSSMVEIAPDLTRFAHPLKPDEWARQIYELYGNSAILQQETAKIQSEYRGTSWNDTANQIFESVKVKG